MSIDVADSASKSIREEPNKDKSITKVSTHDIEPPYFPHSGSNNESDSDSRENVFREDRTRLKASLKERHLQIIALVGVFGTGIFLSSGGVLHTTGPAGMLIAYTVVAIVVGLNQIALAEVAALMPTTSSVVRHLEHFVDPAWGFTFGWLEVWSCIMPSEIIAGAVIVGFWTDVNEAVWITIIIVLIIAFNSWNVRFYGEVEYIFGIIKICLLIGLMITSLVITCGGGPDHKAIGFKYWHDPGPFNGIIAKGNLGKFIAFWKALNGVVYSYGGVQNAANMAGEVANPRLSVFKACKRVFYRVTTLMLLTVFFLTIIVKSNDKRIASSNGNAESSPFVIAINNAGIKVLPHIINAGVLTSAFSAANISLAAGARNLFALAIKNQAPKLFLKTNKRGLPYNGVIFIALFTPLSYMNLQSGAANVFNWCQNLISARLLLNWILISVNHISLMRAMKAQGIPRSKLPHTVPFAPAAAWISGIASVILLLTGGFTNFIHGHFDISSFFSAYFIIPLAGGLYSFWKFFMKTRYWRPEEVQLVALFKDVEDHPETPPKRKSWNFFSFLWD